MIGAVGRGTGSLEHSLARGGHGHNGHQQPASNDPSNDGRPSGLARQDFDPTISSSSNDSQLVAQNEAFEKTLRSIAIQIVGDAMADVDDAMSESEEDP
ncbi:nodulation protein NopC [Rhizobium grahamii]|uniref:Nodulation protein NopC n=1 Tax=Rhizobium grahamii TaxID=1120045 RepID=A0A370KDM5_9HYPH|nr:nodulation protein NopC [Rhizobium grahamii]RDJ01005.1 hypothetical protein B5K06_34270 [Rhizobium grahamii]